MTTGRDAFLGRVRQAVLEGNRAGLRPPLPDRQGIAYQGGGAGEDLVSTFKIACEAAGGLVYVPASVAEGVAKIIELALVPPLGSVLLGAGAVLERLGLKKALEERGMQVDMAAELAEPSYAERAFAAVLGISGVAYLIAETGSLVMRSGALEPRSLSLLPPRHIAVATRSQILPDLFDLFPNGGGASPALPSCQVLITGPSKTGDIELKLVTGVHGPGEVHVFVMPE